MTLRWRGLSLSLLAPLALAAGPVPGPSPARRIEIRNFVFAPSPDTVRTGQVVTFRNHDIVPHTVTADSSALDSGTIAAGKEWRLTAKRKGVVHYHCRLHPTMHGTLVIR